MFSSIFPAEKLSNSSRAGMMSVQVLAFNNVSSLQAVTRIRSIEPIRDLKVELQSMSIDFGEDVSVDVNIIGGNEGKVIVMFDEEKMEKFFTVTLGEESTELTFKHR